MSACLKVRKEFGVFSQTAEHSAVLRERYTYKLLNVAFSWITDHRHCDQPHVVPGCMQRRVCAGMEGVARQQERAQHGGRFEVGV